MILRPTSSTRTDTLFPSTTLFRPLSRLAKPLSALCRQIFGFGSAAQRARDQAVQKRMNRIARRDDLAAFNGAIPAPELADASACFAHHKVPGGDMLTLPLAFPNARETPYRAPRHLNRRHTPDP